MMTTALAGVKSCDSLNLLCQTGLDFVSKIWGYFSIHIWKRKIKNEGTKPSLSGYK